MSANNGSGQGVALSELSLWNCPQGSGDIGFGHSKKRTTETPADRCIPTKRQRERLRQPKLYSEPYDSPRSSRRSTPTITLLSLNSNENGTNDSDSIERLPLKRAQRYKDSSHNDLENRLDEKVRSTSCTSRSYRTHFKY